MSLWGCNCPLLALAAWHWRGPVCSRLSLFSPLFSARAWRCLRLGLALSVVAIPQSGLWAQVSSLRLPSGHSFPVITLSNVAHTSLPSPRLPVANAGVCAASPLGEWPLGMYSVDFNYLFIFPPCYFAFWDSKARHRPTGESVSWFLETSLFSKTPFPGRISVSTSFVSFFYLLYFFQLPFEDNGLPFCLPDVLWQHSEAVLWNLLSVQMFFQWICGRESCLPDLFLCHLRTASWALYFVPLIYISVFVPVPYCLDDYSFVV